MDKYKGTTLKDVDFDFLIERKIFEFNMSPLDKVKVIHMLKNDANFFRRCGLMDYSLLLGFELICSKTDESRSNPFERTFRDLKHELSSYQKAE